MSTIAKINPRTWLTRGNLNHIALGTLLAGASCIAFAPIFVRLSEVGPGATAFWRIALALPAFWLWASLENRQGTRLRPTKASDYHWLIACGLFFAGDLAMWHWSLQFTKVSNSVLLANSAPIFVTLGAWLIFKQRITSIFLMGLVTAVSGAFILIGTSFTLNTQYLFGDMLAILTAMFYAGYILTVKQLRASFSTPTVLGWSGLVTCLVLFFVAYFSGEPLFALSFSGWAVLFGLAWFSHVGGQGLIAFSLAHLPAPFSAVTLLFQPVLSTLLAWIILSETIGPEQALGGIIILVGIMVARRGSRI